MIFIAFLILAFLYAMISYLVSHRVFTFCMIALGVAMWFARPLIIELIDQSYIWWLGWLAKLRLHGLAVMGVTRVRARSENAPRP
jgi:hypothetical protein